MPLEKWYPLKELEGMRKEMEKIWEEIFPARKPMPGAPWKRQEKGVATPPIDIIDKDSEVIVKAEMPGVAKENIEISLQENTLTVKGEIKAENDVKEENYSYCERDYRYYARSISIPFKISPEKITASLKDGILYIHMPKAEEVQPKKIKVEVA